VSREIVCVPIKKVHVKLTNAHAKEMLQNEGKPGLTWGHC